MPVDDKVELHLIDTRELVEEARKIREARDLSKQAKDVKKELTAGVSPLEVVLPEEKKEPEFRGAPINPQANKPKTFFESEQQTRRKAIGGARAETAFTQQQSAIADLKKKLEEQAKKQSDFEKAQKDLAKQVEIEKKEIEERQAKFEENVFGTVKNIPAILTNPGALPINIVAILSRFGIIGAVVGSVLGYIIGPLQNEIAKQFDRGGIFSTKLKVPRQALTLGDIEVANSFRDGTKYITNDLRIVQKAPQNSNTLKISHEAIRYIMDDLGRGS